MRLLIVDDLAINRKLLRAQLEAEGHSVVDAVDGVEALKVLSSEIVDGVISDILMPNMDGYRLCLEVRKNKALFGLPFIFYTSTYKTPKDRQLANSVGGDEYLTKPAATQVIIDALAKAMNRSRDRVAGTNETLVLKQYNESLVHKIEERNLELENALTQLQVMNRLYTVLSGINGLVARAKTQKILFDEACRIAVEQGNFGMAWISQLDPVTLDVTPIAYAGADAGQIFDTKSSARADIPRGQGVVGRAIRTNAPSIVNNLTADPNAGSGKRIEAIRRGYRSLIALPLLKNSAVFGTLTLYATEQDFFNENELNLLTELASNISFAMDNIARQQRIEKMSRIRSVLGEINAAIVRIHDKQELYKEVCKIATGTGRFPFIWIGIYESAENRVRPVAWDGTATGYLETAPDPRLVGDAAAPDASTITLAVLNRKPVLINDLQNDPRIKRIQLHLDCGTHSLAVVPLLTSDEVLGVFILYATETGFFDEEETRLLMEMAGDIAFALQNIDRQEQLDFLSYYDAVTGLPNRRLFLDRAAQQLRPRSGEQWMAAMILLNIDHFRYINESYGRNGGDEILRLLAQRIEKAFRSKDYVTRLNADNFGIIIRAIPDIPAVVHAVENLVLGCFREPFVLESNELRVSAKAGIAMFPADGTDVDVLLKNAETALAKAHDIKDEKYLFYSPDMNDRVAQILALETRLRRAVDTRQFVLYYQPKIDLAIDKICGLEALIRWQDPEQGLISPADFVPLLEDTGLIVEVGQWVIHQALADYNSWKANGCETPRVAVNVSAIQLQRKDFTDMVISAVQAAGDIPEALEIEVTESMTMQNVDASIRVLATLRGLGIHIAMDDFGTGYSSLNYIARLPLNTVKIDRSFIIGIADNPNGLNIVSAVVALAHTLGLRVVAEGVETAQQVELLKSILCDEAQGYFYSKPLPSAQIEQLLRPQQRQLKT